MMAKCQLTTEKSYYHYEETNIVLQRNCQKISVFQHRHLQDLETVTVQNNNFERVLADLLNAQIPLATMVRHIYSMLFTDA